MIRKINLFELQVTLTKITVLNNLEARGEVKIGHIMNYLKKYYINCILIYYNFTLTFLSEVTVILGKNNKMYINMCITRCPLQQVFSEC